MSQFLSRRDTLMVIASLTASPLLGSRLALADDEIASLGAIAAEAGILFGTSIAQDSLDVRAQADLYRRQSRILTADWAMKFDVLRPEPNSFRSLYADAITTFADRAALPLRGTSIAWNESRPDWLMQLSGEELRTALDRSIDETAGYFAGQIHSWDAVNEPFWPGHGLEGGYRDGPWVQAFGPDYVERVFRRAASADPLARLMLNEAATEQWTETGAAIRSGLLTLVDRLQDAGVRLDAVGLQGHLQPGIAYDDQGFVDFLWQLSERKVDIYITELDVNDDAFPDDPAVADQGVADRYEAFLTAVLTVPAVTTVICWQLADNASWYRDAWKQMHPDWTRQPRPLPFDAELRPKLAYDAIAKALRSRKPA